MKKQTVILHFPEVGCYIGNKRLPMAAPMSVKVTDADDIKNAIKRGLPNNDQFRTLHGLFKQAITDGLIVELEDGSKVPVRIDTKARYIFSFAPERISDSMFEKEETHLVFRFGNAHHTALWRLDLGKEDLVSNAALDMLINVDLVDGLELTSKGYQVLTKVWNDAGDVASDERSLMTFAKSILERVHPTTPMFDWAKRHEYVTFVSTKTIPRQSWYIEDHQKARNNPRYPERYYPTIKGAAWLKQNIKAIVKHQSCSDKRRKQLIEFLPEEYLPKYLTHDDEVIRDRAARRSQMLNPIGDA